MNTVNLVNMMNTLNSPPVTVHGQSGKKIKIVFPADLAKPCLELTVILNKQVTRRVLAFMTMFTLTKRVLILHAA